MKKQLILALVSGLASSGAMAATSSGACGTAANLTAAGTSGTGQTTELCVCGGSTPGVTNVYGGSGTPITATAQFIKNGFDMQCGANTFVSFKEHSSLLIGVAAGSVKGNQTYRGNSNGGAIGVSGKCSGANGACTGANVTTAIDLTSS